MRNLEEKAKKVKLLILDMDGVMTDGRLTISDKCEIQRHFHVIDGHGIVCLQQTGVKVAVITTCSSDVVPFRMGMLGIEHVYRGQNDKQPAYNELLVKLKLREEETAYLGDDLPDLPLILRAGLGMTVPAAVPEVKAAADGCTEHEGGRGAVREVCELIMRAQGTFDMILSKYR